jgi:hypothetical protein
LYANYPSTTHPIATARQHLPRLPGWNALIVSYQPADTTLLMGTPT